jgi:hypothetical protein
LYLAGYKALQSKLMDQRLGKSMLEGIDDEGRANNSRQVAQRKRKPGKRAVDDDGDNDADDDDGDDSNTIRVQNPPRFVVSNCWLCMFANSRMAAQVSTFVSTHAGTMDPAIMAQQIKAEVLKEYPRAKGVGRRHVMRHLREHVLTPSVRLASVIRSLLTLAETLRGTIQQVDANTGDLLIDKSSTELYLKVLHQLSSVYKTDSGKLIFQQPLQK